MKKTVITLLILFCFFVSTIPSLYLTHAQTQQPTVTFDPNSYSATSLNDVFKVTLNISNVQGLWGWDANVTWNPQYLNLTQVTEGDFVQSQVGTTFFVNTPLNAITGKCEIDDAASTSDSANGTGVLVTLTFQIASRFTQTTISANFVLEGVAPTIENPNGSSSTGPNPIITPTSSTAQTAVTLNVSLPPVANAGSNQTVLAGTQVVFNASQSISSGSNPTYTWTFTDVTMQNLTGITATYTFKHPGTYLVTLTVQDSIGSDTSTATITVLNSNYTAPTITISGVASGEAVSAGKPITFMIDASTLRNVPVSNFVWSMGDGKLPTKTTNGNLTYTYFGAGTYNVNVTISYKDGLEELATTAVTVAQGSQASPTSSPGSSTSSNPSETSTAGTVVNDGSSPLPPTVLGIIIAVTLFVLGGSVVWLRNQKNSDLNTKEYG